ncbi:MAG: hypothetical protein ACUVQG_09560 [Thermogutta sp.]
MFFGRRLRLLMAAVALSVMAVGVPTVQLAAQTAQLKPVVVVGFSGIDRLWEDADFLGNLAGVSNLADNLKQALAPQTGDAQGVPGVASGQPLGLVVQTNGMDFIVSGYLPVADLEKTVGWLKSRGIDVERRGSTYQVDLPNGQPVFVTQKGGWAIFAISEDALSQAAASPPKELEQLSSTYDLGVSLVMSNIPPMWKQLGIAMMQQGIQTAMEQQAKQSDKELATVEASVQRTFQQLQEVINELDYIIIGVNVDSKARVLTLDSETTFLPSTEAAKELALNKNLQTHLAGFLINDATISIRETAKAGPREVARFKDTMSQYDDMFSNLLEKDKNLKRREKELLKRLLSTVLASLAETSEKDQLDLAVSLKLDDKNCEGVMAMTLVGTSELEAVIADILKQAAKDNPEFADSLKLNAETYKGIRFHVIEVPAEAMKDAPQAVKDIFGSRASMVLGFGDKLACAAFGPDAVSTLKAAIDRSESPVALENVMDFYLAVKPLLRFLQTVASEEWRDEDRQFAQQLITAAGDKDRVTMTSKLIENGSRLNIELQEGVLTVLAQVIMKAAQQKAALGPGGMSP